MLKVNEYDDPGFLRLPESKMALPSGPLVDAVAVWPGHWFHAQLTRRNLLLICRVAYERVAYLGTAEGGAVRLTFDRNIRGVPATGWELIPVGSAPVLLPGRVVCEFKFRLAMPALFKAVVADLGLTPAAVSKYRTFMLSAGLAPAAEGPSDG